MKTASIVASLSRNAGGLFESVRRLHRSLAELPGVDVRVLGLEDEYTAADLPAWAPVAVRSFPVTGPRAFGYSPSLRRALLGLDTDILHVHGIWQYPSVAALAWNRKRRRPYVVSPHGMLDPWAARNSAWKKAIALFFYENDNLRCAACIRALCQSEADSIRKFGLKNPICVIPNGIDLPVLDHRPSTIDHGPLGALKREGRKVLLYLGRIHPKKGLVNLLKAWAAVQRSEVGGQRSEWVLAIAGWDQGGHEAELKRLATELGILWSDTRAEHQGNSQLSTLQKQDSQVTQNQHIAKTTKSTIPRPSRDQFLVQAIPHSGMSALNSQLVFLGPQFNEDKATCYRDCDAFILPSFSEGLPMVVLEAWAYAKPVLITPECNLPEGFDTEAALRIEPTPENIAAGLRSLLAAPRSELQAIGQRGRTLVEKKFSWPTIAGQMKEVYDWVLGGGVKPESVQKAGLLTETLKS